jgi:outer membrane receptor protein involved in Fe transport
MKNILIFLFFLSASVGLAQQPNATQQIPKGNGRITGVVMDSLDNVPVQFATVALTNRETNKPIDGTVADEKGKFTLTKVPAGQFDVVISFVGYMTKTFRVNVTANGNEINLGIIKFSFGAEFLKDIVVEGQRNLFEEKVDRTVYNAENDNTTKGGDATDVMRRVPMLSVDLDGNVSMRGNSNVRVLINNKPSTIMASSVADALKQIPADQIKSIEVITSPSAKYDAEGSAGIINIITKKNNLEGLTLNIDAGAGLRGSNLGLNGNYRKGKMGFSLGGFGRAGYNVRGSFDNTQIRKTYLADNLLSTSTIIQSAKTLRQDLHGRYQLGWDYEINKQNSLAASVRFGLRNNWNYQNGLSTKSYDGNDNLTGNTLKQVDVKDLSNNVDINLDYTKLFTKPQQEFSVLALYSRNDRTNDSNTITDSLNNSALRGRLNNNKSNNQEVTIQADYQTPIGEKQLVEVGAKNISRTVSSEYEYFNSIGNSGYVPVGDGTLSNNFSYNQNVTGGYMSYTYNSKSKYSFKAGGRYEYTTINANFSTLSTENPNVSNIRPYGVFVPSLNISRKLKAGNTIKAAYNKRIQRPSIQFLNPNIQSANPLLVTQGNPNLLPEYTDNFELSYSTFIKATTLNFSAFYRNTTSSIQSVRTAKGDTLFTNYANIGKENAYGLNFFGNVNLGKNFSLNGGVDSYYSMLDNNSRFDSLRVKNSGWVFSGRLFGNYNLKKGWGLQFFSFFRGRQVNLQGFQGGFRMYSLSVRKEFNEKRGSIGLGIENFVTPSLKIKNEIHSTSYGPTINNEPGPRTTLDQNSTNVMYNLSFRVNFSYRIGKMSFENNNRGRKKSINNDDLKDGGGDGNQGGGGGMDQGQRGGAPAQINGKPGSGQNNKPKTAEELKKEKEKKPEEKKEK